MPVNRKALVHAQKLDPSLKRCLDAVVVESNHIPGDKPLYLLDKGLLVCRWVPRLEVVGKDWG